MSDNYITICTDKEIDNLKELSFKLITWIQEYEIIEKELSKSVLGVQKLDYKLGKKHVEAIGFDEDLLRLQVCGMEVKPFGIGRN